MLIWSLNVFCWKLIVEKVGFTTHHDDLQFLSNAYRDMASRWKGGQTSNDPQYSR